MSDTVKIEKEFIKLQDLLKYSGICQTGGQAKILIQNGEVFVNGEVCSMRGKKLHPGDKLQAEGKVIEVTAT